MKERERVSIIVPCYCSGEWLSELVDGVEKSISELYEWELILVNDCSPDDGGTWNSISQISKTNERVLGIDLQKNYGQFNAILCGIEHSSGDIIVTMDDDLQHDSQDIPLLIDPLGKNGTDCVIGVFEEKRHSLFRNIGSFFVRMTYRLFHNLPTSIRMSSFRAMTREVALLVGRHRTSNPVIGAIILESARKIENVKVNHRSRKYGRSGYGVGRLVKSALDNVFLATTLPLRLFTFFGLMSLIGSIIASIYYVLIAITSDSSVPGFTTIVLIQLFLVGITSIGLGLMGEYLDRIIDEVGKRPRWHVREVSNINNSSMRDKKEL